MAQRRSKDCPYKKTCTNVCYGSQPCDFALAFEGLERKIAWWRERADYLMARLKRGEKKPLEPRICGDYVLSPCRNVFNGRTSWWISKKYCTVARYCFTAGTDREVDDQLADGGAKSYIEMFEGGPK